MPLSGIIGAAAAMFAKAAPPPPTTAAPYPPGALASSAMPRRISPTPGATLAEVATIERCMTEWLEDLYKKTERKKFLFKPILYLQGHVENDLSRGARRYAIDMRVVLQCHDGQRIRVDDAFRFDYLVEHDMPFPFGECARAFSREIISKMPDWRELYLSRHEPQKDDNSLTMLTPAMLAGVAKKMPSPMIKPPPMPGSLAAGASSYSEAYRKSMVQMIEMHAKAEHDKEAMKIKTDHLYGYATPPREKK